MEDVNFRITACTPYPQARATISCEWIESDNDPYMINDKGFIAALIFWKM
jgi:hypothetical protein